MAGTHDDAVVGFCSDSELAREGLALDDERVIAGGGEGVREIAENTFAVVVDRAGLAVEQLRRPDDFSAESRADGLVAQADAQNGEFSSQTLNQLYGDSSFLWRTGSRRNDDSFRL